MSMGKERHILVESIPLRLAHKITTISHRTNGASNSRDHSTHGVCMLCIYVGYTSAEITGMMIPIQIPSHSAVEKRARAKFHLVVKFWARFSIGQALGYYG